MRSWVVGAAVVIVGTSAGGAAVLARVGPEVKVDAHTTTTTSTTSTTFPPEAEEPEEPELLPCSPGQALAVQAVPGDPVEDWATLVIDPSHALPKDFVPPDLVKVSLPHRGGEITVREIVVPDLMALIQAAEDNGSPLTLISGYRSFHRQSTLYQQRVSERGEEIALATTARPGHSEHQLGTAVDVLTPGMDELSTDFASTPAGQWLAENGHEYGFVISYPEGTTDRSCYSHEPWHIRYVGPDVAQQIATSGLTPREWMLQNLPD